MQQSDAQSYAITHIGSTGVYFPTFSKLAVQMVFMFMIVAGTLREISECFPHRTQSLLAYFSLMSSTMFSSYVTLLFFCWCVFRFAEHIFLVHFLGRSFDVIASSRSFVYVFFSMCYCDFVLHCQ